MNNLLMELRSLDITERTAVGVVAPYDEHTYRVADPGGERIVRGAFTKSIRQRGDKIPLLRNHDRALVLGRSRCFEDTPEGLIGTFKIHDGPEGDRMLEDLRTGGLSGFSVGFMKLQTPLNREGVREIREGKLEEVSAVGLPAYEGAGLLAVRNAQNLDEMLAPFRNPPVVNLEPVPPLLYRR